MTRLNFWKWLFKTLGWAVNVIGLLYGLMITGYLVGRFLIGERWSMIELGSSLMPALLFPIFVFAPLALLTRRWKLSPVYVPALIFFAIQYSPVLLPNTHPPDSGGRLRVLTYNLGSIVPDDRHTAAVIRSANADVVALQELLSPVAATLMAELGELYPYRALHPSDGFAVGVGLLSKYPILDDAYLNQMVLGGQRASLTLDQDTTVTILNVHPVAPRAGFSGIDSAHRSQEIGFVLNTAARETDPLLLIGDFNITDQTDDYARIAARYSDAFRASGTGFGSSFPNFARFRYPLRFLPPIIRIDYVFFDANWRAVDAYTLSDHGGSDHFPVLAELEFTGGRQQEIAQGSS